ncbi:hypothetical protein X744_29620 [Mesorhizobium sp. LNJC372A00]|nr:hypothetical protein X745_30780 [Mesorhizobium sp. LNJC374B00]ESY52269.1 hypothetical protein X744_29620 [Mesorhizobium sp. LNJC372A00]
MKRCAICAGALCGEQGSAQEAPAASVVPAAPWPGLSGRKNWTRTPARWLAAQKFGHPAQQIVLQDQVDVITDVQDGWSGWMRNWPSLCRAGR